MNITTQLDGDLTIININETRIDASVAPDFKHQMDDIINEANGPMIVDLSQLNFMDSSSLGAMVSIYKSVKQQEQFILAGASGVVQELFKLTRMDTVFQMSETIEDAKQICEAVC